MELKCTLILFGLFLLCCESRDCDEGFMKINRTCVDEDECETLSPCGDNAQCINIPGSYYCTCDEGFRSNTPNFTAKKGHCVDINECIEKTPVCSDDEVCVNTIGSYNCTCPKGYHESRRTDSECEGLFLLCCESRDCEEGFMKINRTCVDEDECETLSPCGDNAQCLNIPGSYYCTCDKGFYSDTPNFTATTGQCVDINECIEKTFECSSEKVCVNTFGSYNCTCPKGYRESRRTDSACEDINECADPDVCGTNADCYNYPGGYSCKCHQGYSNYGNDQSKCEEMVQFCQ